MLGTIPSNLIPYFDFNRFAEYLVDGQETIPANAAALDANLRAIAIVQTAEGEVAEACRARQMYSIQVLRDLVWDYQNPGAFPDGTFGAQIMRVLADLAWGQANLRKRYSKDTPQGQDPGFQYGADKLEKLQRGSRIFIIEGMRQRDPTSGAVIGRYLGQDKPAAGIMTGSTLKSGIGNPPGVWGNLPGNPWGTGGGFGSDPRHMDDL